MSKNAAIDILVTLARHNQWANKRTFDACAAIPASKVAEAADGYNSVMGILTHLVQVEHSFFELAQGRKPRRIEVPGLPELWDECGHIDADFVEYVGALGPQESEETFLVPWFGFEVSRTEGVLQPLTHSHKHRADVSMLLPRLGGEGVEMDLIQWLDEERGQG